MAKGMSPVGRVAGASDPKANVRIAPHTAGVGNETKADMKGAGVVGDSSLSGATAELRAQHPHAHSDHGPHHGGTEHIRHKPMKLG